MKIVFALLLAVAWVSTASASDCKNIATEYECKYNADHIKNTYHMDMCTALPAKHVAEKCQKFCKACGPWNACNDRIAGPDNVMCIYKKGVFGSRCGNKKDIHTGPISKKLQKDIVDRINKWRQKVASGKQPGLPAGTIPDVHWDDGLAAAAQRWTDQCPDQYHKHSKNNAIKQFPAGASQNVAIRGSYGVKVIPELTVADINFSIDSWYTEYKDFVHYKCPINSMSDECIMGKRSVEKGWPGPAKIGHFTALIWAKSTSVGCGWIKYQKYVDRPSYHGMADLRTFVCDFGPAGNVRGEPIYIPK